LQKIFFELKKLNEYIIPFKGLKDGEHDFDYVLDKSFLKNFDNSDVKDISMNVNVKLVKNNSLLEFIFHLNGIVVVECDRCLDDVFLPINFQSTTIAKTDNVEDIQKDDIIYLSPTDSKIDISQIIYENIIFSIPLKRVHPVKNGKSQCNPQMLKKLNKYLIENTNEKPDARWNELNKMLNN